MSPVKTPPEVTPVALSTTIPYARPYIDTDDRRVMREVLSGGWLTTGKQARGFEDELAQFIRNPHVLAVSSCTAALHLALELLDVRDHLVVVPTLTFTATAAAVVMAGGIPVLADVDPTYLTMGPEQIGRATRGMPAPAAVMPVHYGGNPSGFAAVLAQAEDRWAVVDDAAHALPAYVDSCPIGAHALGAAATCFSFYPTKPITTGEGGALAVQSPEALERARRLSLHGIDADAYQRSRQGLYHYSVTEHGWKYNLPDVLAALGRSQLKKAQTFWGRRTGIADAYIRRFQRLSDKGRLGLPVVEPGCASSWHLFVVRFPAERFASGWTRDRVAARLRELGIGTSMHYVPLHRHPYWQRLTLVEPKAFPAAEDAYAEILSLPLWCGMTEAMVDEVTDRVEQVCREAQR